MKSILYRGIEFRREIILVVNDEDLDGPPIPILMNVPPIVYRWDVPEIPPQPLSRKGRPLENRHTRLQNLLKARDQIRGEEITQQRLLAALGYRGDTRKIRHWLHDLALTWDTFKTL